MDIRPSTTKPQSMKPLVLPLALAAACSFAAPPEPKFQAQEIAKITLGYGLAIADVDGDGRLDILLADKTTIQWYQNPTWQKHVIAEHLTPEDNVCLAARDIDGDGKCELAVGAGWNPSDTTNSGAIFYMLAPPDRTQRWAAIRLPHEPTVHRMQWVQINGTRWDLLVQPLHGRGNQAGVGRGAKLLAYQKPPNPRDPWPTAVVNDTGHFTHNFDPVRWRNTARPQIISGAQEGIWLNEYQDDSWRSTQITQYATGELRAGRLAHGDFIATVEPFHGSMAAIYTRDESGAWQRKLVLAGCKEGHAVATADFLGVGSDQLVVGWRTTDPGIRLLTPLDEAGENWRVSIVATKAIAVEDLKVADLNADGRPDLIVAGRQTKNLMIFWNTLGGP